MKIILIAIYCLLLISCSQQKTRYELIKEKEISELEKGIKRDTVFLDFVFGMSEKEVNNRFEQLFEQGKISITSYGSYIYISLNLIYLKKQWRT